MKYEMLYLIDSSVSDEGKDALVSKFETIVSDLGGKVLPTDKGGTKKLAYPINYKTDAYYVLMTFDANGDAVKELDRIAGITDEVVRRMITKAH